MLVLAGQASPARCLVILTATVTAVRQQRGLGGAGALVAALVLALVVALAVGLVVVGEDGDFTDALGDKFWNFIRR